MTAKKFPAANSSCLTGWGDATVNRTTGNLQLLVMDYRQKDIGQDFVLCRCYDTLRVRPHQPLGERWLLNFGGQLLCKGKKLRIFRENFHRDKFSLQDGRWQNEQHTSLAPRLAARKDGWTLQDTLQHAEYEYDLQGRLLRLIRHGSQVLSIRYNGKAMETLRLASGQELQFGYRENKLCHMKDALGRVLTYTYEGDLLQRVTYSNHGHMDYTYDADGLLLTCRDRNGILVLQNQYDAESRLVRCQMEQMAAWLYEYREQDRQTAVSREEGGSCRIYGWNQRRQIERIIYADGTEQKYCYDPQGRCILEQDRLGRSTQRVYDQNGLLLREELPGGVSRSFGYDAQGNLVLSEDHRGNEIRRQWSPRGQLLVRQTRLGERAWREEAWEYDELGRIVSFSCNGRITRWLYRGEAPVPSVLELPDGSKFSYRYDKAWRCLVIASAFGERSFGWNPLDLVVSDTDAAGKVQTRRYDLQGHLVREEWPEYTSPWQFRLDAAGHRIWAAHPSGTQCKWTYDSLGRLVMKAWSDAYKEEEAVSTYAYDDDGRCIRCCSPGEEPLQLSYDAAGRLTARKQGSLERQYRYDEGGRMLEVRAGEQLLHSWQYSTAGLLQAEQDELQLQASAAQDCRICTLYGFDVQGKLLEERRGYEAVDGQMRCRLSRFTYDRDGHCIEARYWQEGQTEQSASGKVLTIRYQYDAAGRLQFVGDSLGARAEYSYNSLNRRISEKFLLADGLLYLRQYVYDAAGELSGMDLRLDYRTKGKLWRHLSAASRQQAAQQPAEQEEPAEVLQRNAAGWPVQLRAADRVWQYAYSAQGQVLRFTSDGQTGWYRMDAWGRIEEAHALDGRVLYVLYDLAGNIQGCIDGSRAKFVYCFDEINELESGEGDGPDVLQAAQHLHQQLDSGWQQRQLRRWAGQPAASAQPQTVDLYSYLRQQEKAYADAAGYVRKNEMR